MRNPGIALLAIVALSIHSAAVKSLGAVPAFQALAHPRMDPCLDSKRLLRARHYEDKVDEEERGVSAPSVEMLQGWLKKGLISDDTVGLLTLGTKADDVLTSSLLNAWVTYVKVFNQENPAKQMGMIETLTTRFGDDVLATLIEVAKRTPKTEHVAKELQIKQIQHWLEVGQTPDDVFALLKLNSVKSLLFDHPQVNTWMKYMDEFAKVNPGAELTTITTLRKFYTDDALAKMIVTAAKSSRTSAAAKRVEAELLRDWFNSMKTPTDIMRLLNLHKLGLKAPNSPLYPILTKYTNLVNTVDPRFKKEMLQNWLKKGLLSEDEFALLTLGKGADDLLTSSQLSGWVNYINLLNKENPTGKLSALATLTARFGDDALATMIEAAKKVPKAETMATQLQSEQIKHWLDAGKLPDDIFVLLKLNTARTRLFDQPQINTWAKFVDDFKKRNPKSKTTLFSLLAPRYKESTLAQMLLLAKLTPGTEGLAMRIQAEQTRFWLRTNKTPAQIFQLLKLNEVKFSALLSNPIFRAWVQYTDDFRKMNAGTRLTTMATMRKYYTDEGLAKLFVLAKESTSTASIAQRLESELLREWYVIGKSPVQVFSSLNLHNTGRKVFESPLYSVWTNYVAFYNKVEPSLKADTLGLLTRLYDDTTLPAILLAAEKVQSTKSTATTLLKEQLKMWLEARKRPEVVYFLLRADTAATKTALNWQLYSDYAKLFARA